MCRRATCDQCNKPTFAGCGMHVEQVLKDVPKAERCQCREQAGASAARTAEAQPAKKASFWRW